jgi:small subunit ribosomal protein S1
VSDASQSPAPHRLEDLKRKQKLTGTVKKVELFGAFVDLGVGRDGLVHISAMSAQPINRVEDVVKEGDTVTVWVRRVDPQAGRIDLTMIEPLGLDWDEIKSGQLYKGKVTKIEKFGAFVDIGAERPGLIHISELASYRVEEVNEIVKVGDEVEVKVIGVDTRKRQIKLSIKAIDADVPVEVETEETPLTAMQIALQRAMGDSGSDEQRASNRRSKNRDRQRRDQEDLLSRTLITKRK